MGRAWEGRSLAVSPGWTAARELKAHVLALALEASQQQQAAEAAWSEDSRPGRPIAQRAEGRDFWEAPGMEARSAHPGPVTADWPVPPGVTTFFSREGPSAPQQEWVRRGHGRLWGRKASSRSCTAALGPPGRPSFSATLLLLCESLVPPHDRHRSCFSLVFPVFSNPLTSFSSGQCPSRLSSGSGFSCMLRARVSAKSQ